MLVGLSLLGAPVAFGGDALVIISGGGTPFINEYSHYLQARAFLDSLAPRFSPNSVWVFFGAGNRVGFPALYSDTHRQVVTLAGRADRWEPGFLPGNRPATRDQILRALRDEVCPVIRNGGTLFLLVGDHGHLSRTSRPESQIVLWQFEPKPSSSSEPWSIDPLQVLGAGELFQALSGRGRGRVVFSMSQCYSGGFHQFFEPGIAGFSSTDGQSIAAGCVAAPEVAWSGYARFFPEALTGRSLADRSLLHSPLAALNTAHDLASLEDLTLDLPQSSSEAFLVHWLLQHPANAHQAIPRQILDGGGSPPAFLQPLASAYAAFIRELEGHPEAPTPDVLRSAPYAKLEALAAAAPGPSPGAKPTSAQRAAWLTIRPLWKAAILKGAEEIPCSPSVREFELGLIVAEAQNTTRDFTPGFPGALLHDLYRATGGYRLVSSPQLASELSEWCALRQTVISMWAKSARGLELAAAGVALGEGAHLRANDGAARGWLRRVMFHRRVLAGGAALLASGDQESLVRFKELRAIEETPLPVAALK